MKNKIKRYIQNKGSCNVTDILAQFLISFEDLFPILCDLYSKNIIKQKGDQKIVFMKKNNKTKKEKNANHHVMNNIFDDEIEEEKESFDVEKLLEEIDDDATSIKGTASISGEELVEKIIYEEIFSKSVSKEEAIVIAKGLSYDDKITQMVITRIKKATEEEIQMFQTGEKCPEALSWDDKDDFESATMKIIEEIVSKSVDQTRKDAIIIAKDMLEKAKETFDNNMIEIYMRVYYEFRIANEEDYDKLKKQIFS